MGETGWVLVEPSPSPWVFPDPVRSPDDLIAVGADLEPGTLLEAYRRGIFPMPLTEKAAIGWYSPVARAVLPLDGLRVTRSMRQAARHYRVTVDECFLEVVRGCADPSRAGAWIDESMMAAYHRLL